MMNRFDKIAKDWDTKPRRVKLAYNIYKAIDKKVRLHKGMNALDIGAGTGLLLMHIQPYVHKITGMDNSNGMLEMLKEKATDHGLGNVDYLLFDADTDELAAEQYDLAVSSMTFHHFSDPENFLKTVFNSLRPGGKLCVGDLDKEDGSFHTDNEAVDVKFFGFDRNEFNQWMINAGFKNTEVENVFEIEKNDRKYPVFLAYGEK
jgi:ubiquinone/menaquinone biosynthesis C-methylase UbiE